MILASHTMVVDIVHAILACLLAVALVVLWFRPDVLEYLPPRRTAQK